MLIKVLKSLLSVVNKSCVPKTKFCSGLQKKAKQEQDRSRLREALIMYTCLFSFAGQCGLLMLEVTDEAQLLAYPYIGNNYFNNEKCSWTLTARDFTSRIRITFLSFATRNSDDFLKVSCHLV